MNDMTIEIISTENGDYQKVTAEEGYILTHEGDDFTFAGTIKNQSLGANMAKTVEHYETIQEVVNRVIELELVFTVQDIIDALDEGAIIPDEFMAWAGANATEDEAQYL